MVALAILITIAPHFIVNVEAATSSKTKQYVYFKDKHHLKGGLGKVKVSSNVIGFHLV